MDAAAVVQNAIEAVERAIPRPDEIVETTRRIFRRRQRRDGEQKRGRKPKEWKFLVFLLSKANDDYLPTSVEINRLQRCGYGYPSAQLSNQDRYPVKTAIPVDMPLNDFQSMICTLYPDARLGMIGFTFAKCDQGKKLRRIEADAVADLKSILKQGKLYLIPNRDLRMETPLLMEEETIVRENVEAVVQQPPPLVVQQPPPPVVQQPPPPVVQQPPPPVVQQPPPPVVQQPPPPVVQQPPPPVVQQPPPPVVQQPPPPVVQQPPPPVVQQPPPPVVQQPPPPVVQQPPPPVVQQPPHHQLSNNLHHQLSNNHHHQLSNNLHHHQLSNNLVQQPPPPVVQQPPPPVVQQPPPPVVQQPPPPVVQQPPPPVVQQPPPPVVQQPPPPVVQQPPPPVVHQPPPPVVQPTPEAMPQPTPNHIVDETLVQMDMSHDSSFEDTDTPVISFRRRRMAGIRARETIRQSAARIMTTSSGSVSPVSSAASQPSSPLRLDIDSPPRIPPLPSLENSPSVIQQSNLDEALSNLNGILSGSKHVTVRRNHVVKDLMDVYGNADILQHMLNVSFEGEEGQDAGGLTKDVFTAFWERAYVQFFCGEDLLVPFMPPHKYCEAISAFPILGRILCHGIALIGFLPVRISRTVLLNVGLGPMMDEKILLQDFLSFISEHERELTRKGLDAFDTLSQGETCQLIDMFSRFNMSVVPTRNTFKQHVLNLAVYELTGKPSFLCNQMKSGIPDLYQDVFFHQVAKEGLVTMCERLAPTPSRVSDLLRTDHQLRPEEDRIFYFLKDFVLSLSSHEDLIRFLQFVTGSSVMPSLAITVIFHHADGLQRHPIGRTCGNVLELPLEYDTLQEFKREFLCIIRNDDSFQMHMA
ncbi:uncharacterized protein [Argopecten irradians]|uniref:uncharacterized protein n=1 Tax=Argopecten irradians TaxID=31199 RepID=UPI003722CB49